MTLKIRIVFFSVMSLHRISAGWLLTSPPGRGGSSPPPLLLPEDCAEDTLTVTEPKQRTGGSCGAGRSSFGIEGKVRRWCGIVFSWKKAWDKEGETSLNDQGWAGCLLLNDDKAEEDARGCLVKQLWIRQLKQGTEGEGLKENEE